MLTCSKCKLLKNYSEFSTNNTKRGYNYYCKLCKNKSRQLLNIKKSMNNPIIQNTYKICKNCGLNKTIENFKPYKNRKVLCITCKIEYRKKYAKNNYKKILNYKREYDIKNAEKLKKARKKYRQENKEKLNILKKLYYKNNINAKLSQQALDKISELTKEK